jgi:hypothetical protein
MKTLICLHGCHEDLVCMLQSSWQARSHFLRLKSSTVDSPDLCVSHTT